MTNNTFKHSGSYGDMIFGLPAVIALGGGTYYLRDDQAPSMKRLLEVQPYLKVEVINHAEWKAFTPTHDLDRFRGIGETSVVKMHLKAFNLDFNLQEKYLFNIQPLRIARIAIQDTGRQRFPGHTVNWEILRPHLSDCVFIGNDTDYEIFLEDRKMNIPRHKCDDIYEFAQVIAGCDLFVGNMSIGQTIAEGLKKPYVVDLYIGRPQFPLTEYAYVGLCPEILYWTMGIPYDGIPRFSENSHGD
jgi:hypothetical protein